MSLLWRWSGNYNTILFVTLVTLFWQLQHNSFLSLSWRCYDNYNTMLFVTLGTLIWQLQHNSLCHSCDVVLTITTQFVFITLVVMTIIIQLCLSILWRCSDNCNTIRFCYSCDVVLTIIMQFVFVTFVMFFWQL